MQFDLFDAGANTILGAESYGEFKEKLRDSGCDKCALHAGRTNIVVDRGNPEAYIMTIGEGPGENEDKQALAFVGRAGKMFDKIMDAVVTPSTRRRSTTPCWASTTNPSMAGSVRGWPRSGG